MTPSKAQRDRPHLCDVGTADPVLHRPSNRRTEFQWRHAGNDAWHLLRERSLELGVEPLARRDVLGDNDGLGKKSLANLTSSGR